MSPAAADLRAGHRGGRGRRASSGERPDSLPPEEPHFGRTTTSRSRSSASSRVTRVRPPGSVGVMVGRVVLAGIALAFARCAGPMPAPASSSSSGTAPPSPASSDASEPPCNGDADCGAGLVCFRNTCQSPTDCTACPADAYCDGHTPWCQSCPERADGPIERDFDFEGLRYHVEARRVAAGNGAGGAPTVDVVAAFLPSVEITVTSKDGQRHGVHRASAFTHASHTSRSWGTLSANAPHDGVPDTCLGAGDNVRLTFDLASSNVEVRATQHLEVTYGVLTGDCAKVRARVHVVTVRLDWSCRTPAFWITAGPEKPMAAVENR